MMRDLLALVGYVLTLLAVQQVVIEIALRCAR